MMSLLILIVGVLLQLLFGAIQFNVILWWGLTKANNGRMTRFQTDIFEYMIWLLPANSVFISGLLVYFYFFQPGNFSNWWHLEPIVVFAAYFKWSLTE